MDEVLADRRAVVDRLMPAVLLTDYASSMQRARQTLGVVAGPARGHGWAWLRARAIDLVAEIAAAHGGPIPIEPPRPAPAGRLNGRFQPAVLTTSGPGRREFAGSSAGGPAPARRGPAPPEPALPELARPDLGPPQPDRIAESASSSAPISARLTARELEILAAIASGKTNPQIAKALFLSVKTVMHHSTNIYRKKLGVRGRAEAVALAYQAGLLGAPSP